MLSFCGWPVTGSMNNSCKKCWFVHTVVDFNIGWVQTPSLTHCQAGIFSQVLRTLQAYFFILSGGFSTHNSHPLFKLILIL